MTSLGSVDYGIATGARGANSILIGSRLPPARRSAVTSKDLLTLETAAGTEQC